MEDVDSSDTELVRGFTFSGTLHSVGYKFGCWLDSIIMELPLGDGDRTTPGEISSGSNRG